MNRVVKVFAWIGVIAIIFIIIIIAFPSDTPSSDTTDSTDVPTLAVNSPTATFEAKATLEALQPILTLEQSWPASFTENFTDNSHKWETGDVRDSYINGNRSISDGTYTWNITTVKSASDFSFPDMPDQTDFLCQRRYENEQYAGRYRCRLRDWFFVITLRIKPGITSR